MNLDQQSLSMALQYLDKVGEKIGMTADTIWPWLVRQQYVYIGTALTLLSVGLILLPIALYISNKYHPFCDDQYGTDKADLTRVSRCAVILVGPALTIAGFFASIINIPKLFNPEYYALRNLLELIK